MFNKLELFVHHWRKRHWLVSLKVNDLCWLLVVGIYSSSDTDRGDIIRYESYNPASCSNWRRGSSLSEDPPRELKPCSLPRASQGVSSRDGGQDPESERYRVGETIRAKVGGEIFLWASNNTVYTSESKWAEAVNTDFSDVIDIISAKSVTISHCSAVM